MTYKNTVLLQRLKIQSASTKNRWIFLLRCVHHKILPKSFHTRPVLRTQQGRNITFNYNMQMLKATSNNEKKQYHKLISDIKRLTNQSKRQCEVREGVGSRVYVSVSYIC